MPRAIPITVWRKMQSSVIAECFIYYRSWNLVAAQEHCNLQVIVNVKQWRCREKYSNHVHGAANAQCSRPFFFKVTHQCSKRPGISKATVSNGDVMISHWHPVPWGKSNLGTTHTLKQMKVITANEESCQVLMVNTTTRQQWNSSRFSFSQFGLLTATTRELNKAADLTEAA